MPSPKKPETTPEPVTETPAVAQRASESSDPAVHQLLAQRQTATMNEDLDQLAGIDRQLVDLGFIEYQH